MQQFIGSVCIVTPDLIGPVANGGIGTSCAALSEFLADGGFQVSVLLTLPVEEQRPDDGWWKRYQQRGIEIHFLSQEATPSGETLSYEPNHPHLIRSLHAYEWLAARTFRIIFFMDWQGAGFHSLSAKAAGLAFGDTWLVVHAHSPTVWHSLYSYEPFTRPEQLLTSFLERRSVELADVVVSPTQYMLDWMSDFGWTVAQERYVLPNLVPQGGSGAKQRRRASGMVRNVVFFGRLERRKGLELFCDAIDRIEAIGERLPSVVFLGKFGRVGASHAGVYILNRAAGWSTPIQFLCALDQPRALEWLVENDALAVIPSVMDNAPYTIAECVSLGVPFIARSVGGVPEMITREDREHCLVGDNPAELMRAILNALSRPMKCPRAVASMEDSPAQWITFLATLLERVPPRPDTADVRSAPLVSVCIVHKDRPQLLLQAIRSVQRQTYKAIEVILVDDGSTRGEALDVLDSLEQECRQLGWRIIRQANNYLGAARNAAVRAARGEWVLFLDDDNVCKPDQVRTLVGAALTSGADIVTCCMDVFEGDDEPNAKTRLAERFIPLGGALAYGLFRNGFGDACALYRRSTFEALGGFSEDYGLGNEDYEFFAKAALSGAMVMAIPNSLFWYRRHKNSMLRVTSTSANALRAFRPYISWKNADLREVALIAHGAIAASNMEPPTPPVLDLLNKAQEILSSSSGTADVAFWRRWAMAILSDTVTDLNSGGDPNCYDSIAKIALLCACCNIIETANELLNNCFVVKNKNISEIVSICDVLSVSCGDISSLTLSSDTLASKALVAASWFLKLDQETLDVLVVVISKDSTTLTALIVPEIIEAIKEQSYASAAELCIVFLKTMEWQYTNIYKDVDEAVREGHFSGGAEHYVKHGRSENRRWPVADALFSLFPSVPDPISFFHNLASC